MVGTSFVPDVKRIPPDSHHRAAPCIYAPFTNKWWNVMTTIELQRQQTSLYNLSIFEETRLGMFYLYEYADVFLSLHGRSTEMVSLPAAGNLYRHYPRYI
jgi:G:T/U-mismatch repair DNA glycosylase